MVKAPDEEARAACGRERRRPLLLFYHRGREKRPRLAWENQLSSAAGVRGGGRRAHNRQGPTQRVASALTDPPGDEV